MSAGDATTSHKPYQIQEEFLGPKQVMMSRRSIRETTVMLDSVAYHNIYIFQLNLAARHI